MERCVACGHMLGGIAGVPAERGGRYERDVRCPECGHVVACGTRILVGTSTSQPFVRRRSWLPGWAGIVLSNDGPAFVIAGGLGLAGLVFVGSIMLDVIRGIRPEVAVVHLIVGVVAALMFVVSANALRRRIRANVPDPEGAPPRPWRVLEAGPLGVRWADGAPPPREPTAGEPRHGADLATTSLATTRVSTTRMSTSFGAQAAVDVRCIRLVELFPSGDGMLVQAIAWFRRDARGPSQSDAIYLVLPPGAAARVSAGMMDAVRGREGPSLRTLVGWRDEADRSIVIEGSTRRPRRGPESSASAIGCFIGVLVFTAVVAFLNPCMATFVGVTLGLVALGHVYGTPRINHATWTVSPGVILRQRGFPIHAGSIARVEVEVDRGVPVLRFVRRNRWFLFRRRLVPDDWRGLAPEAFAREVERVLRAGDESAA